ncbi:hypothetical protein M9H77_13528 [Catharanthus roseus]|uniref:Uncharacterized protein n=1 Tax=Catharanthus roseus TaxID=4058 RepID=A0ACC0BKR6_CATRO|nr:hypothetical protein M9H77_13528 [Catharanthus roseus]
MNSDGKIVAMDDLEKSRISTFTGFSHGSMAFRYLGIPLVGVRIDHIYMRNSTIWNLNVKKDFPPFIKRLLSIWDELITMGGSMIGAAAKLDAWHMGSSFDTTVAYDYYSTKGRLPIIDGLYFLNVDKGCKWCKQVLRQIRVWSKGGDNNSKFY